MENLDPKGLPQFIPGEHEEILKRSHEIGKKMDVEKLAFEEFLRLREEEGLSVLDAMEKSGYGHGHETMKALVEQRERMSKVTDINEFKEKKNGNSKKD